MKLYENFEKAYKLITESEKYEQLGFKNKFIDDMIKHFQKKEEYEKCSTLIKIKCWRYHQDKKYNL